MLLLGFLFMTVFGASSPVFCDCDNVIGFSDAKQVFRGTVISIERRDSDYVRYEVSFDVDRKLKGRIKGRRFMVTVSCLEEACCGVAFEKGKRFEVYTYRRDGVVYTKFCTFTREIKPDSL